ncbi:NAD(P)/FAD-dependent oxidoreductase [Blastococcus sp. MG754426]|uniref:phytoene desaturase family protein n=1 Tax=unclassified Blastococcus TaxID=2619396 RepID=UPI001EF09FF3|nr:MULTISPECIES: NAD(P)/FAD-dependent oxidoreductase [unclassified Blastococcus]MCF6505933.1 NAD(P)/FAD-dependent oxidoreductase [Blastococcus sp. MG754426]MCF6510680.1 NAD(P)/FAD-dependent oxidoreductase [Blastococcus sp. MG754427]
MNGKPDAVVVGAGPNGLAAALRLAAAGLRVQVVEAAGRPGGGMRTEELIRAGFHHDVCSTVQPLAAAAPFFREFDLPSRGVRLVHPDVSFAHPLDGGRAAVSHRSLERTAAGLGADADAYRRLFRPLVEHGGDIVDFFLTSRLRSLPTRSPVQIARFGLTGLPDVRWLAHRYFDTAEGRALLGGAAAHGMLDLRRPLTSALGMLLAMLSHHVGWPLVEGGSQQLADAMVTALEEQGGEVVTGHLVTDLREFEGVPAVLLDTTPDAFVAMAGDRVHEGYRRWVRRYRHGAGVFKIDWILSEPVPWANADVRRAGTVHVAGTLEETIEGERAPNEGRLTDRPYVLAVQPTVPDPSRAPDGGHIFWAYVHVPHGSDVDMTEAIERQVERFAPGFRDTVVDRHTKSAVQMEQWNPTYLGGDISNGQTTLRQMLARPVPRWNTYKTPVPGVYLASSATPPGPAVHGACGDQAARVALREVFGVRHVPPLRPPLR